MKQLSYITPIFLLVACTTTHAATTNRVTNANDSGTGSLRDALAGNADRIEFNIPGPGVHTITLATPLPEIRRPVTIDGYTQPKNDGSGGFASPNTLADGDNAVLL